MDALRAGATAFALSFVVLMVIEAIIHRVTKNRNKAYRWGVLVFALLIGAYEYFYRLGG